MVVGAAGSVIATPFPFLSLTNNGCLQVLENNDVKWRHESVAFTVKFGYVSLSLVWLFLFLRNKSQIGSAKLQNRGKKVYYLEVWN